MRHDDASALAFLKAHHPLAVVQAFRLSRHPAQRADIFRLAHLAVTGGVYVDADDRALTPLDAVIPPAPRLFGYQENYGTIGNNVLAAVPGHPVIAGALAQVTAAINRGDNDHLWLATGPGLLTRAVARHLSGRIAAALPGADRPAATPGSPTPEAAADAFTRLKLDWQGELAILEQGELQRHVGLHCRMPYKKTPKHWGRTKRHS